MLAGTARKSSSPDLNILEKRASEEEHRNFKHEMTYNPKKTI